MKSWYKESETPPQEKGGNMLKVYLVDHTRGREDDWDAVFFNPTLKSVQTRNLPSGQSVRALLLENGTFRIRSANKEFFKQLEIPNVKELKYAVGYLIEDIVYKSYNNP